MFQNEFVDELGNKILWGSISIENAEVLPKIFYVRTFSSVEINVSGD